MSTDTPRTTDLNDEEADELLDRLLARADEREDVDLSKLTRSGVTRRTLLGGMAGAAGIGALTGNASAVPSWGNASGNAGSESNPFSGGYIKDLQAQTVDTDVLAGADIANASSGTVPTAQGDGSLAMGAVTDGVDPAVVSVVDEDGTWTYYDPASYADLFAALNQVMTDVSDTEEVTIYLPYTGSAGISASTTFTVPTGQRTPSIHGWGWYGTLVNYTATDGTPAISVPTPENEEGYTWSQFALSGPGKAAAGAGNGIEIGDATTDSTNHGQHIDQLRIRDFPGRGAEVYGFFTGTISRLQIEENGGDGLFVDRLNGGNIQNCMFKTNGGAQVYAQDCLNGLIGPANDIDAGGGGSVPAGSIGVRVTGNSKRAAPNIVDNYFEQNETHVSLENDGLPVRECNIRGNRFQSGTTGVHVVNNVSGSLCIGNLFQACGSNDILLDGVGMVLGPNTHANFTSKVTDNTGDAGEPNSIAQTTGSYPW